MTATGKSSRLPIGDILFWMTLLAASVTPIVSDLIAARGFVLPDGTMVGRDFLNAWAGGQLVVHGQVDRIYSVQAYIGELRALLGHAIGFHAFSYPPTLLLFLWPLGLIGYVPAFLLWIGFTGAAFLMAARPYLAKAGLPVWLAALLPASMMNVWAGHHGFVLAALWLGAFAALPKRPVLAGLLIALLTLKPHMGVLIPLLLLLRLEWRATAAAIAGTLALVAASLLVFGWSAWASYFEVTAGVQVGLLTDGAGLFLRMMPTPYVSLWTAGSTIAAAVLVQLLFAVAAVAILVRAALRDTPWAQLGMMAATATFLVLPYAFNYDMGVVGIAAAMLLYGEERELTPIERLFSLLALAAPVAVLALNPMGLPILPVALLGFLHVQSKIYVPAATGHEKRPRGALPRGLRSPA